jgi:RHS repeat-associated protein
MSGVLRKLSTFFALFSALAASGSVLADTSATRTSSFAYDAASGLLTQEVIEPNTTALRLETDYVYDAFGHKTQVTVSGVDITTRSATATYDSKGQFVTSATNALNQSESWQYDPRFGLPTSHTGPNGLTTTWSYDTFGRKVLEVRADGTRTTWSYQYCSGIAGGTATCPGSFGAYLVQVRTLAADGVTQIGPTATTYYNTLDQVGHSDTQGFDGSAIRVSAQHDALGRITYKSRPYYAGASFSQIKWTTYSYDVLNRVLVETSPDASTLSHAYHGLSTTDTNALSQTRTTLRNSQGQTVSVTDTQSNVTSYVYDPFGNPTQVTDAAGNVTTMSYDTRGRKISHSDPDAGTLSYTFNVLDQQKTKTDAAWQVTTVTYDLLGRMTQRVEPDVTSTWTYDTAAMGVGKLASASTSTGYSRTHSYDSLGRPSQVQFSINSANYTITTGYDGASRVNAVTYPSGFAVAYAYNTYGFQTQLTNFGTGQPYWTANAGDAELHLAQQTAGNGVVTSQTYDANTGLLTGITAGNSGSVENFSYTYDTLGKLLTRGDANSGLQETFGYDTLNRLTSSNVNLTPTPLVKTFGYSAIGNLTSKSDVGTYSYPAAGQARPHGVTSISGSINTTFAYDAKGNMTTGNGLTVAYASFNKPTTITRGTTSVNFSHDPEHQRYRQVAPGGTTIYLADAFASGILVEQFIGSGGSMQWNNYLVAGGQLIGMRVELSGGTVHTRYFHKDHLGSISTITDENGVVLQRLSYDAWGKRRFPNGADDPSDSITSQTTRGFTGHEELDSVALVHMNGRVYDPLLARFGTPDPYTDNPFSTQGWNRYSYAGNSPVNFIDPSGYCFMGCFWKPIFKAIGNFFRKYWGVILQVVAVALCEGNPVCAVIVGSLTSAFVAGVTSGNLGVALRAGFLAAVSIAVLQGFSDGLGGGGIGGDFGSPLGDGSVADGALNSVCEGCTQVASNDMWNPRTLRDFVEVPDPPVPAQPWVQPPPIVAAPVATAVASPSIWPSVFSIAAAVGASELSAGRYLLRTGTQTAPPPTKSTGFPNSQIPDVDWKWSEDPNNSRLGEWTDNTGRKISWDNEDKHWDLSDKNGKQRFDHRGTPLDRDTAHGEYRGPPRRIIPRWKSISPWTLVPDPCITYPDLCLNPDEQ